MPPGKHFKVPCLPSRDRMDGALSCPPAFQRDAPHGESRRAASFEGLTSVTTGSQARATPERCAVLVDQ